MARWKFSSSECGDGAGQDAADSGVAVEVGPVAQERGDLVAKGAQVDDFPGRDEPLGDRDQELLPVGPTSVDRRFADARPCGDRVDGHRVVAALHPQLERGIKDRRGALGATRPTAAGCRGYVGHEDSLQQAHGSRATRSSAPRRWWGAQVGHPRNCTSADTASYRCPMRCFGGAAGAEERPPDSGSASSAVGGLVLKGQALWVNR